MVQGGVEAAASIIEAATFQGGLAALGKAVIGRETRQALQAKLAKGALTELDALELKGLQALERRLDVGAAAASVGATEAMGAYSQTMEAVLNRSYEKLFADSSRYRELVRERVLAGQSRPEALEAARNQLAHETAIEVAATTGVGSAAIGALLPEAVISPFKPVRGVLADSAREAVEEGSQGFWGAVSQNLGIQRNVDPNQDTFEGAGGAAGSGAVLGALSAGGMKAPGALLGSAEIALQPKEEIPSTDETGGFTYEKEDRTLIERGTALSSKAEEFAKMMREGAMQAFEQTPAVKAMPPDQKLETSKRVEGEVTRFANSPVLMEVPGSVKDLPSTMQDSFVAGMPRAEAALRAAKLLEQNIEPDKRMQLSAVLLDLVEPFREVDGSTNPFLGATPESKKISSIYKAYAKETLESSPIKSALSTIQSFSPAEITNISKVAATPKGLGAAKILSEILQAKPESLLNGQIDPKDLKDMLSVHGLAQNKSDFAKALTPNQEGVLQSAFVLLDAEKTARAGLPGVDSALGGEVAKTLMGATPGQDRVATQLLQNMNPWQIDNGKFSVRKMVTSVAAKAAAGEWSDAREVFEDLRKLAQNQINKVQAYNLSIQANGAGQKYDQLNPITKEFLNSESNPNPKKRYAFVQESSEKSVNFAKRVNAETELLKHIYNMLLKQFPELGSQPLTSPALSFTKGSKKGKKAPAPAVTSTPAATTPVAPAAAPAPVQPAPVPAPLPKIPNAALDVEKLQGAIKGREGEIHSDSMESGYAYDEAGNLVAQYQGDESKIEIPYEEKIRLRDHGNITMTHNHTFGLPLSHDDLRFAVEANLAEVRAVTHTAKGVWSFKRPAGGWKVMSSKKISQALHIVEAKTKTPRLKLFREAETKLFAKLFPEGAPALSEMERARLVCPEVTDEIQSLYNNAFREVGLVGYRVEYSPAVSAAASVGPGASGPEGNIGGVRSPVGQESVQPAPVAGPAEEVAPAPTEAAPAAPVTPVPLAPEPAPTGQETAPGTTIEPEVQEDTIGEEKPAPTTATLFPGLATPSNPDPKFYKVFKPSKNESWLAQQETPRETLMNLIVGGKAKISEFNSDRIAQMKPELAARWTRELAAKFPRLLRTEPPAEGKPTHGMFMREVNLQMNKQLQEFLNEKYEGETTFKQALGNGKHEQISGMMRAKPLALVRQKPDGEFEYEPRLLEIAIIAALQWHIEASNRESSTKYEQVLKDLGLGETEQLNQTGLAALAEGMSLTSIKPALASKIMQFWGLQEISSEKTGYTVAIAEAMAAELLRAMSRDPKDKKKDPKNEENFQEFVTVERHELGELFPEKFLPKTSDPEDETGRLPNRTIDRFTPVSWNPKEGAPSPIYDWPSMLEDLTLKDPESKTFLDGKVPSVSEFQFREKHLKLTQANKTSLKNQQRVIFRLNPPMVGLLDTHTDEEILEHFGVAAGKEEDYHPEDYASRLSVQKQFLGALRQYRKDLAEVRNIAGDRDIFTIERRYKFEVSTNQRTMMQGAYNPQSSKLIRELWMPTWSRPFEGDSKLSTYEYFMVAQAQALGAKVHWVSKEENVSWAEKAYRTRERAADDKTPVLVDALALTVEYLNAKESDPAVKLDSKALRAALGKMELTPIVQMALFEMARYEIASQKNRLKYFETPLYLEADGMSNGYFNVLGMMGLDQVHADWLETVSRGGAYYGNERKTADELRRETADALQGKPGGDIYQKIADRTAVELRKELKRIAAFPKGKQWATMGQITEMINATTRALRSAFPKGVMVDPATSKWVFGRDIIKNPAMQITYGAQDFAIASGLSGEVVDRVHKIMSEIIQDPSKVLVHQEEFKDLQTVTLDVLVHSKKDQYGVIVDQSGKDPFAGLIGDNLDLASVREAARKFKISPEMHMNLTKNIRAGFVESLRSASNGVLGKETVKGLDTIVKATNYQATFARAFYIREILKKVEENKQAYIKAGMKESAAHNRAQSEFLSTDELNKIFDSMASLMPYVTTDSQKYLVAKESLIEFWNEEKQRWRDDAFTYSLSLDRGRRMETVPFEKIIDRPGAAMLPFLAIGLGDARMVRNIFQEMFANSLQIYDGVNLPIGETLVQGQGTDINSAAMKAWEANFYADYVKTFERFLNDPRMQEYLKSNPLTKEMDEITRQVRAQDLAEKKHHRILNEDPQELLSILQEYAILKEARNRALRKFPLSFEQMAATYQPAMREGTISFPADATWEQKAALMQQAVDEMIPVVRAEKVRNDRMKALAAPLSEVVLSKAMNHKTGVRILSKTGLAGVVKQMTLLDPAERGALEKILKSPLLAKYRFIVGDRVSLEEYQKQVGLHFEADDLAVKALLSPEQKIVFLPNASLESLVHGVFHAAASQRVRDDHGAKKNDAVQKVLKAMESFRALDRGVAPGSVEGAALIEAQKTIEFLLGPESVGISQEQDAIQVAYAVDVFLEWANETNTRHSSKQIKDVAEKGKAALKDLFWFGNTEISQDPVATNGNLQIRSKLPQMEGPSLSQELDDLAAFADAQDDAESPRLAKILRAYNMQLGQYSAGLYANEWMKDVAVKAELVKPIFEATKLVADASNLFEMNSLQRAAFHAIASAFMVESRANANLDAEVHKVFDQFLKVFDDKSLLAPEDVGDQGAEYRALEQFRFLTGRDSAGMDPHGRSMLLPVFRALATVYPPLRQFMEQHSMPQQKLELTLSFDQALSQLGEAGLKAVEARLAGVKEGSVSLRGLIDQVNHNVMEEVLKTKSTLQSKLEQANGAVLGANGKMAKMLQSAAHEVAEVGVNLTQSKSLLTKGLGVALQTARSLSSERDVNAISETAVQMMDRWPGLWNWVKDLLGPNGLIGRISSQRRIYDMIKEVRGTLSQRRQAFRENTPAAINSKFSRPLTKAEKDLAYRSLGRSGLAHLLDTYTIDEAVQLAANGNHQIREVMRYEERLKQLRPLAFATYSAKIDQLVESMQGNGEGTLLLRNATAISKLPMSKKDPKTWVAPDAETVKLIEKIITLRYLRKVPPDQTSQFAQLAQDEKTGLHFMLAYLKGRFETELEGMSSDTKMNYYHGSLPSESKEGHVMVVKEGSIEEKRARSMGYTKLGKYEDPRLNANYWYSSIGGSEEQFNQGLIQNVQETAFGVNTRTNYTSGLNTWFPNRDGVRTVSGMSQEDRMYFNPVFDSDGRIVAMERKISPTMRALVSQPQDLSKMLGHWHGRQIEEVESQKINERVIAELVRIYQEDPDKSRYVDAFDPKNSVVERDAVSIIPGRVRDLIEEQSGFTGEGRDKRPVLMVRRNMLTQIIGYRNASLGDFWTGNTDIHPAVVDGIRKVLMRIFGESTYNKIMWAEKNWQALVASARTNVVVRSMIVPFANTVSGVLQLMVSGVPLPYILKKLSRKFVEIESYSRAMGRKIILETDLAGELNPDKKLTLQSEIQNIEDSLRTLSIWPLTSAGEFSTIADVGDIHRTESSARQTLLDTMEEGVKKIPPGLRSIAQHGYLAKDTAAFKGLYKWVQYSDFLMKAVYHDFMIEQTPGVLENHSSYKDLLAEMAKTNPLLPIAKRKARERVALGIISEEFNNYDLPSGRERGYVEAAGLGWFLSYKIRATKIGLSMIRNNPLYLLMYGLTPGSMGVGLPVTDNILARIFGGSIGNALGPGTMMRPIAINPWWNLLG